MTFRMATTVALVTALVPTASQAAASPPEGKNALIRADSLVALVEDAELIFLGRVEGIEYAFSVPGDGQGGLPHTFVRFHAERVLKGAVADPQFTLRFLGGPAGGGRVLRVSDMPLFDVGEQAVVFSSENGRVICPVVGWQKGRFRVVDGRIFSELGQEVHLGSGGRILRGKARDLEEVRLHAFEDPAHPVDLTRLPNRGPAPGAYDESRAPLPPGELPPGAEAAPAASLAEFLHAIETEVAVRTASPEPQATEVAESADPGRPFSGPDLRPVPFPSARRGEKP